jgi:hypothetical protein
MGRDKVILAAMALLALTGAAGLYVAAETGGLLDVPVPAQRTQPVPEAA